MSNNLFDLTNALPDAVEKAGKSIVLVDARRRLPASGLVYASNLVLTSDHVVERDEDIKILLAGGEEVKATLAGRDPATDLAVLKLENVSAPAAEKAETARVGQLVLAVGRPTSAGLEASLGVLSAISGPVRTSQGLLEQYYRTDTTPYPGFSGGPLLDVEGRVLGINTSGFGRGTSITIPAGVAWRVAEELALHGSIKRGFLGIRSQPVELNSAAQAALKRSQAVGLLVVGIEDHSPAGEGGILVGDTLVGINNNPVSDHDELYAHLSGEVVGKPTPVEVLRGGTPVIRTVTIGERQPEAEQEHGHRGRWHGRGHGHG
ncbi:MAG TPA: trypsin-like peptidase domain-containing protein [Anaerolineales bacterium]